MKAPFANGVNAAKTGAAASAYVSNTGFGALTTDVHVVNLGAIGLAAPVGLDGVLASTAGTGAVIVENAGSVAATLNGVRTTAAAAPVFVSNAGTVSALNGAAIAFDSALTATVLNSGLLTGAGLANASAVVAIDGAGAGSVGATSLTNTGVIRANDSSPSALAIAAGSLADGAVSVTNSGDTFQNAGVWRMSGTSDFFGGANTITNTGVLQVAGAGQAVLSATGGSLVFNNAGVIDLQNDGAHSVANMLTINGTYNALPGAGLAVDAFLGPSGSTADRLTVNGGATGGVTLVSVRDAGGMGADNPFGITVARITGANTGGGFALNPASPGYKLVNGAPVIEAGFYYYALEQHDGAGCDGAAVCYSLYTVPSARVRMIPVAVAPAQALWQETALMWEDRQSELRDTLASAPLRGSLSAPAKTEGFSAWIKPLGAWTTRESRVTSTIGHRVLSLDLGYRQNSLGLVGGLNYALDFLGGGVNVGAMGGYVESDVGFRSGEFFRYQGATAGASATYVNSGFFVDGLFKADLLSLQLGVPLGSHSRLWTTAETLGGVWNAGYRYDWGRFFFEPSATLTYSTTHIGRLDELGSMGVDVRFRSGEDFRGGLGGRLGVELADLMAGHLIQASVTGRVWDQFDGQSGRAVDILSGAASRSFADDTLGRVYSEVKGNLAVLAAGPGLGAYVSGGGKFNDQFTTWTARGGLAYRW